MKIHKKLIPGLSDEINSRLEKCCIEIEKILDKYFPEFKALYGENDFYDRLFMTIYIEMIHAGFFTNSKENSK